MPNSGVMRLRQAVKAGYQKVEGVRRRMVKDAGLNPDEKHLDSNPRALVKMGKHIFGGAAVKLVKMARSKKN